jgi:hypothetical protein
MTVNTEPPSGGDTRYFSIRLSLLQEWEGSSKISVDSLFFCNNILVRSPSHPKVIIREWIGAVLLVRAFFKKLLASGISLSQALTFR